MAVKAPEAAGVGQLVTINVYDKIFGDPIPNAGVWSIRVDDLETINGDPNFYVSLLDDEESLRLDQWRRKRFPRI